MTMKRQKFCLAGLFIFMVCFGFFIAGCSGGGLGDVNVHFATQGQGDNLMTADQEIYYGPMMGDTFDKTKPPREGTLGPFPNTKWQILSVVPKPKTPFNSMYLAFQPDGTLIMTTESPDGKISTSVHKYSVVGESMLLSKPGSSTNVRFRVDGNTMHVDTGRASIVLEKVN
jgi:hypothetical protein